MNIFGLSVADATILLTGLSAILIPFVIAWLPTIKLSDYAKFGILVVLSLVGGFLTAYISGALVAGASIIATSATILSTAQIFYYGAFRLLGLEKVLFPQQAVTTEAKEQAKDATPVLTKEQAKDVLNPVTPAELEVTAQVVNK
jgi:hypothetical protein